MSNDVELEGFEDLTDTEHEFEEISDFPTVTYGENLNQGHDMILGERVKLAVPEMMQLKSIIDKEINSDYIDVDPSLFGIDSSSIKSLCLTPNNEKLNSIPVSVEEFDGRVLVKVGPCDLSGVGGHQIREQIIKNLVNQALIAKGLDVHGHNFENVNVSACVGVRGRSQMFWGLFSSNREQAGSHMNAYVKTSNEKGLTHWEPRQGPQRWYNDTICAMVTSTTTSLFEKRIRENTLHSNVQATAEILKHPSLVEMFDALLAQTKTRISNLVANVKKFAGIEEDNTDALACN